MNSFVVLMFAATAFWAFSTVVPQWPYALTSWQFRSPEKMMPSARRWRVFRAHSAVLTVFFAAGLVLGVWPGTRAEAATAALTTLLVGDLLLLVWFLVTVFSRRHEERLAKEAGDIPPNEPSDEGYLLLYASVGFTAIALAVLSVILYGLISDDGKPDPITPEEQAAVDDVLDTLYDGHLHPQAPVVGSVPEGAVVAGPVYLAELDADRRLPRTVWDFSIPVTGEAGETADELLAGADIAVGAPFWICTVTHVVVVETEETVTVGLVVTLPANESTPAPSPSVSPTPTAVPNQLEQRVGVPECEPRFFGDYFNWYPIDLDSPLGDREVVSVTGYGLLGG